MLPLASAELGWSSFSIRLRTWATRAGLAARKIKLLARGSAITVVLKLLSAVLAGPGAPPLAPGSSRRVTSGASSLAMACLSTITSMSLALDTSSAAMMRPRRCKLSA